MQRLSSLGTQTMANNEKNEQVPASTPTGTNASNSLKNRTSASDERPPLMASLPARREASDERSADWSREDDPDIVVRPASQQRRQQGGQRRRNKDYDDEEEEIELTEELRHGAHSLVKLVKLAEERDEPLRRSLVYSTTMMWAVGMADRDPEQGRARKTSPEGADEERQALVSGGSDDEDIETEMLEESNASARRAMRALGRSETSS